MNSNNPNINSDQTAVESRCYVALRVVSMQCGSGFRSEMNEKSRLYEEAAAAAADMTLLLGGYRHQHAQIFTGVKYDEQAFESSEHSLLDPVNRSPDSCFADYYSQTDPDLSD